MKNQAYVRAATQYADQGVYAQRQPVWSNIPPVYQQQPHPFAEKIQQSREEIPSFLTQPAKKKIIKKTENHKDYFWKSVDLFQQNWYRTWVKQELNFSMNKISLAGLLFGLMFLGSIFFLMGFLVAVNLYGHKTNAQPIAEYRSIMPQQKAVLTGRTTQIAPSTENIPAQSSLDSNARIPSSLHQPTNINGSFSKPRIPSQVQR